MKASSFIATVFIVVVCVLVVVPIGTNADTQPIEVSEPVRLINLLSVDDVVSVKYSDGSYLLDILDERVSQTFKDNVEQLSKEIIDIASTENNPSEDDKLSQRERIKKAESEWYRLSTFKIVHIGDDFVRLESIVQLPHHEQARWIAIPQYSIGRIMDKRMP